jgi:uncharacterized protein
MRWEIKPTVFLIIGILVFGTAAEIYAIDIPVPAPNPVVDLAGIIKAPVEAKLNRYLRELKQKTSAQVAIITIESLEGQSIEDFSLSIAHDKWKLGQKGKDNGVLLAVALNDRKYRIEVGYGLEATLPDSLVGAIGRQYLVPYFKKGDYSSGIYAAALTITSKIAANAGQKISGLSAEAKPRPIKTRKTSSGSLGKIISLLIFMVILFVFIRNPRSFLALMLLSSMGGRRGHWGGSGGGFGGGGFGGFGGGGGGFGGGGASGGW